MTDPHGGHGGGDGHGDGDHGPAEGVGEVAEGVGNLAGGVAGMIPGAEDAHGEVDQAAEDAKEALETVETVGETAGKAVEGLNKLGKGVSSGDFSNIGGGVGGITDAARYVVPEGEAREVLAGVGQAARGLGQIVDGAGELLGDLMGQRSEVEFHLEVSGLDLHWHVQSVHFEEAIGTLYSGSIEARLSGDEHVDEDDLLTKDVNLSIERGEEARSFRGIVRHANVRHRQEDIFVHLDVAPAIWMLSQTMDSRVYQDLSVPDLVQQVVQELVGSRNRTVQTDDLTESYLPHEYLVQHRESHWDFLSRLCDEEGIFFYFDHDEGDHEVLVLADSNDNRPLVREAEDGRINFEENQSHVEGREVAYHVQRHRRVGPTDAAVRGFDWTNPDLNVHHDEAERGEHEGPALEIYDHHHAVRHHEYDDGGGTYQSHTAQRQARMQTERLDLQRSNWTVSTTVVTAKPGHIFELVGADVHDGRYLIVSVHSNGNANDHGGEIHNTLEVIPASMPYRPPAPSRPMMPGPETAIVVGPEGEEIHTDRHGRIKVQFHWDRQGQRNEHSSAWIRVSQGWAGPGWGMIFIPRIGMEVIVSFLGGDPDRPIVTGCVYNGNNPPPYTLPDDKTKSTIKTNSSIGGDGYNELRFEDKKGEEEVWIHAEKDFNEVVEHDHTTHVKNCQTNTVDVDQTETVGNDQTLHVKNDRKMTIDGNETVKIAGDRDQEIVGHHKHTVHDTEKLHIKKDRTTIVDKDDALIVKGTYDVKAAKKTSWKYDGGRKTSVNKKDELLVTGPSHTTVTGKTTFVSNDAYEVIQMANIFFLHDDTTLNTASSINLSAASSIQLQVGKSSIKITSSGIEISGPTIKIKALSGTTEIDASTEVKIKC